MTIHPIDSQQHCQSGDHLAVARIDLAAAFRLAVRENWHEGVANHFSLAVSDDGSRFLINPGGRHFSRIKASDLLLVNGYDDNTMQQSNPPDPTAWAIHGAMHRNLPHARCVMHVHCKYATVIACLQDSNILPIDQNTMRFFERVAMDDHYDGMGLGDEAERLTTMLADKSVLMMGNHGVMVCADSVAAAYDELYYLERSCETLVTAYMTGQPLRPVSDEVARKTRDQWLACMTTSCVQHFEQLKAILDEQQPDYRA